MRLVEFITRPLVAGVASVCSIISVPLAIYLYAKSFSSRELVAQSDAASSIVDAHSTNKLKVSFGDVPVDGSVSSIQVVIWNDGDLPIETADLLDENSMILKADPPVRFLDAAIIQDDHPYAHISVGRDKMDAGSLTLSRKILQQDDGFRLRIIYAGEPTQHFKLQGTIKNPGGLNRPLGQLSIPRIASVFCLLLGNFLLVIVVSALVKKAKSFAPPVKSLVLPPLFLTLLVLYLGFSTLCAIWFQSTRRSTPASLRNQSTISK